MGAQIIHAREDWECRKKEFKTRMAKAKVLTEGGKGKIVDPSRAVALLETIIRPGDRVALEGNNQKQAEFLADCLCKVDPVEGQRTSHGPVGHRPAFPLRDICPGDRQEN